MTLPTEQDDAFYLRRMVDSVPALLAYWDIDLRCRFANRSYATWFGADPEGLVGTSLAELLGPELFALNEPYVRGVLAGRLQVFERVIPGPDGACRHSMASYVPAFEDGLVVGFTVHVTEITPIKLVESALRTSEHRFRALAESSPFGIYETDAAGLRTYTNARWQEIYGLSPQQSLSDAWIEAIEPDDREAVLAARDRTVAFGVPFDVEFRIRRPDGERRIVHSRGRPLVDEGGSRIGFVGAVEDVTEQRSAERRLRASEAMLDRTGRLAGVGGWEADLRTGELTWSGYTRQIHDVGPDYLPTLEQGMAFYPPEAQPMIAAALAEGIRTGQPWDLKLPFVSATGRHLWVRALGEVEFESGAAVRMFGAVQDITQSRQQRLELSREQLARSKSEQHARELDQLLTERSEMLDVMAHEVRQPLNNASAALQSAARALKDVGATEVSDRLRRAQAVIGTVMASIDNTLAVASLLARPDPIQRTDADIDMMLGWAIDDMEPAQRPRVQIDKATSTRTASMDISLMRLALRNVLSNALAYSPAGSPVTLRVTDSDDPLALVIDVVDAGSGVPANVVAHLFQRGSRRQRAEVTPGHGLGLGSYIVRRVMELHGGRADLTRNGPDGATIRLTVVQLEDE
ncbi:hypothetical protein BH11PSE8_BH11PSE8_43500 [soil metagenome]